MGYERFKEICDRNGIKVSDVVKNTGIAYATMTSWKQGKYTPKMDKLQKIADYLGVTLGELTAEWEAATPAEIKFFEKDAAAPHPLTDQEQELLSRFVLLDQGDRGKLSAYLDGLLAADKYDKKELFA